MDSVEVAFSNASHEFERMDRLRGNDSLPGAIWDILWGLFVMAIITLVIFVYLTVGLFTVRDQDLEPEEAASDAGDGDAASATRA